jgi:hypothetical protein
MWTTVSFDGLYGLIYVWDLKQSNSEAENGTVVFKDWEWIIVNSGGVDKWWLKITQFQLCKVSLLYSMVPTANIVSYYL